MSESDELERSLTKFSHNLFSALQYKQWRENLSHQEKNRWYSLIVELDKSHCSLNAIKYFGEDIYTKLVYRCIPSPDFKSTGENIILFNFSGKIWHSLIYFYENNGS